MSHHINEQILESLFEKYLEQGYSEEEAAELVEEEFQMLYL